MIKMASLIVFILFGSIIQINGQFPNIFKAMMGTSSTGSGSNCITSAISCMPWCQRNVDSNGCHTCNCQSGGGGMNPGAMSPGGMMLGGMSPGGMNPMSNPMFGGLSGGQSPMTMGGANQQSSNCPAAPRTCIAPPPWCQRLVDDKGCVKCLCGQDLINFQNSLNAHPSIETTTLAQQPSQSPSKLSSSSSSLSTSVKAQSTSFGRTTPPLVQSCLLTFTCPKICDYGYKTDTTGCPLCECIGGGMVDATVAATDPPGKHQVTTSSAITSSHVTTDVISCSGLFRCAIICNNGYKTDDLGCPKCECVA